MSNMTGRKPQHRKILKGIACHWCGRGAHGFAQKGMGKFKPSCGVHGEMFQPVEVPLLVKGCV